MQQTLSNVNIKLEEKIGDYQLHSTIIYLFSIFLSEIMNKLGERLRFPISFMML